jgi:hypothetical protein
MGYPQKLKSHQKRVILRKIMMKPKISAPKLAGIININYNKFVPLNIHNIIKSARHEGYVARKRLFIV